LTLTWRITNEIQAKTEAEAARVAAVEILVDAEAAAEVIDKGP